MSPEQLTALQIIVAAEPTLSEAVQTGNDAMIAAWLNQLTTFYVWRKSYTAAQITAAIDVGVTQVDGLSASKRDTLLWWAGRDHDASLASTQAAINDLCGSQNTLKSAVLDGAKRVTNRAEKALANGTGTFAVPGTATFEGDISINDAGLLR